MTLETLNIALVDLSINIGGGQIALYNIAEALSKRGHNVEIIIGKMKPPKRIHSLSLDAVTITQIKGYNSVIDLMLNEKNMYK